MKQITLITFLSIGLCLACTQQSQNTKTSQENSPKPTQSEVVATTTPPEILPKEVIPDTEIPKAKPITAITAEVPTKKKPNTSKEPESLKVEVSKIEPTETFKSIADLYRKLEKAPQTFSLSTNTQQKIICKQGTVLSIPENAFIDEKTGKSIKGKVDIQIKEYYQKADFITANLTTQTKDAILETGGTIHIEATANGQKCALQKQIEIAFPYKNKKEGMQAFEGERNEAGQMIWEVMETTTEETADVDTDWSDNNSNEISRQPIQVRKNNTRPSLQLPGAYYVFHKISKPISKNIPYPYTALKDNQEGNVEVVFQTNKKGDIQDIFITKKLCPSLDKTAYYIVSNLQEYYEDKLKRNSSYQIPIKFRLKDKKIKGKPLKSSPYNASYKKKKSKDFLIACIWFIMYLISF